MHDANATWRAVGLGAISGLRTMAGPAAVSRAAANGSLDNLEGTSLAVLRSPTTSAVLTAMEIGELIGDKLPVTPSRTAPPSLLGRVASGALTGAALFTSENRSATAGAALGAASAVVAAYAGENLRSLISKRAGIPDPLVALLEDSFVLICSTGLLR